MDPSPAILKKVVELKLLASKALRHIKRTGIGSNPLGLVPESSMVLEFAGLEPNSRYRMLVSFVEVNLLDPRTLTKLGKCKDVLKLELLVFWSTKSFTPDEVYTLKKHHIHVLSVTLPSTQRFQVQEIPDFVHIPDIEYAALLEINLLANEIAKRLRKTFHLVLSDLTANSYDEYGTFATREVMAFEDEMIRSTLDEFLGGEKGSLAIDVGCGNGRHSRVLASHFADVVAFDLSEKMVTAARKKDEKQLPANVKAVTYWECDIEYEAFPDEGDVQGSADFVCASFGMPSFVEDTVAFIRRVYKWLRPGGLALFTFYNSESVALTVETPWKERALSASIDLSRHALDVEIREDRHFSIYCRAFDDRIRDLVKSAFTVRREVTFPHVMAIMPPSVFGTDEYPRVVARDVFPRIDRAIASEKIPGRGHYVFLVLEKVDNRSDGYFRVIETLNKSGVEHEIIAHKEIVSASEAQNELGLLESQMVKTVVFKRIDTGGFLVALVPGKARAEMTALAEAGRLEPSQLVLAPAQEVETVFGFPIGGVSPVGYDSSVAVFVDGSLIESEEPWLYMGVGDNRKTLKITKSAFLRLIEGYSPARLIGT